jgi:hypothetical protein
MFEQAAEEDAKKARAEFDQRSEALAADWPKLVQASKIIAPVRGKWVAHRELEWDPVAKKYKTVALPSVNEVYGTIARVIPVITDSVTHLLGLFRNLSIDPEEIRNFAKRDAAVFWRITGPVAKREPNSGRTPSY